MSCPLVGEVGVKSHPRGPACVAQPSMYAGLLLFAGLLGDTKRKSSVLRDPPVIFQLRDQLQIRLPSSLDLSSCGVSCTVILSIGLSCVAFLLSCNRNATPRQRLGKLFEPEQI